MRDTVAVPVAARCLPVIGHAALLHRSPLRFMQAVRQQGPVVRVQFGPVPVYMVNPPDLVWRVLVTDRRSFEKGLLFDKVRPLTGNGVAVSTGTFHREQRRMLQPAFKADRIARYGEHMADVVAANVDAWHPGDVVEMVDVMYDVTLSVVSKTLFSSNVDVASAGVVRTSLPVVERELIRRAIAPTVLLEHLPLPLNHRFETACLKLKAVIDRVITAYRSDPVDHGDLLSLLVAMQQDDKMSDQQLRDELITILLAGTDTTAIALAWVLHELAEHPEIQAEVQREIDDVVGTRTPTVEDVANLPYTTRVLNESMRRHTPLWITMRRTVTAIELGDASLPKGVEVAISPAAMHRDPVLYPDPLRFDPDRWLAANSANLPRGAFLPFGAGDHHCIGDVFAMLVKKLVLATILARFHVRHAPGTRVREVARTLLRPSSLPMVLQAR